MHKFFNFEVVQFIFFCVVVCEFDVIPKNPCQIQCHAFLICFLRALQLRVLAVRFMCLTHFGLISVYYVWEGSNLTLLHVDIIFPA